MKLLLKSPIFYILLILLISYGAVRFQGPKIKNLLNQQAQTFFSEDSFPLNIQYRDFKISLLPLAISLEDIKVEPKSNQSLSIAGTIEIEKLKASPTIFEILFGKIHFSKIKITNCKYDLELKNETRSRPLNLGSILEKIPVTYLDLENCSGKLKLRNRIIVQHSNTNAKLHNQTFNLLADIKSDQITLERSKKKTQNLSASLQLSISDKKITLSSLQILRNNNYFLASGEIFPTENLSKISEGEISTRTNIDLNEIIKDFGPFLQKNKKLPKLYGLIHGDTVFSKERDSFLKVSTDLELTKLGLNKLRLGDISISGESVNKNTISISKINLNLPGKNNSVAFNKLKIIHDSFKNVKFLHSFLKESKISKANIWLNAKGKLNCEGAFSDTLLVSCPGKLKLNQFVIRSPKDTRIIGVSSMDISGNGNFTEKDFKFDLNMSTPKSEGTAVGVINYSKGFNGEFSASNFDFQEFGKIGNLELEGSAKLSGTASGTGHSGIFGIKIESANTFLSQYKLGDIKTDLKYKKGIVYLENIEGAIRSTRYNGQITSDLANQKLTGKITFPFLRMTDVQDSVYRRVDLKNKLTGSGSGLLSLDTSFDIARLNFYFKANLFDGLAFGESYDKLDVFLRGTEGVIDFKNLKFKKKSANARVTGYLDMNLDASLKIDFNNGNLKESTNLSNIKFPAQGNIEGTGWVTGNLSQPNIKIEGFIKNLIFNDFPYGESEILYIDNLGKTSMTFKNQKKGEIRINQTSETPNSIETFFLGSNFNLAPLISYFTGQEGNRDYLFNITGKSTGFLNTKNWWKSNFYFSLENTAIKYKGHRLESNEVFTGSMKDQILIMDDLSLSGHRQKLTLKNIESRKQSSKIFLDGDLNISFLKLFAPFFERIEGQSTVHMELSLTSNDFKLIGSSYTRDGYLQFPGFPHPVENFTADILYNQNNIVINSMKGRVGGGRIRGQGRMTIQKNAGASIDLETDFEKVSIQFPDGIQSKGSGTLKLEGSKIPYKLSGNYNIESGLIDKEIEEEASEESNNQLLAELMNKNFKSPIDLDIAIDLQRGIEIDNSMARGDLQGSLQIGGNLDAPTIQGPVSFKNNGVLLFKDTEFLIQDSNFVFRGQFPMNPTLFLTAETRLQNYDIQLLLQGVGQSPKFQLSSQPNLTNRQLVSLLTLGKVSRDLEGEQSSFAIINDQENETQEFQIGTNLFKDSVIGKELKRFKGWDIQFSTSLEEGTNYAVPQVLVTKKISKKARAQLNRQTGRQSQTELRLQYEVKDNLSGIFRLKRLENTDSTDQNLTLPQADTQFGLDLEYKREFD